ncbi:hypothetical protein DL766_004227 [Monosporascus sp. MC13-8B]|nr:hypothetical protein DL763_010539 [Monosporascus cannonballus]RYP31848.1 hypothetical protein DL766_004227 [Monosporascus sp. MC13-8B]
MHPYSRKTFNINSYNSLKQSLEHRGTFYVAFHPGSRISGGLADFDDADLDPASGYHPGTPITYNDGNFQDWMPKNIKRRSMSRSASFFEEREQGHQEQGHAQQDGDVEMGGF